MLLEELGSLVGAGLIGSVLCSNGQGVRHPSLDYVVLNNERVSLKRMAALHPDGAVRLIVESARDPRDKGTGDQLAKEGHSASFTMPHIEAPIGVHHSNCL